MLKNSKNTVLFTLAMLLSSLAFAQDSKGLELKGQIEAFLTENGESYKKKHLNLRMREIGSLENEPFAWKEYFMLESKAEFENNLGYTTERDFYFLFYHYETEDDRQYALKYWMEEFIEGEAIRASRPKRSYDYAKPTIILINPTNIIILNYECKFYDEYNFEEWKDQLMKHFGDKSETMIIELECGGPLNWTLNAPDPKIRGLF